VRSLFGIGSRESTRHNVLDIPSMCRWSAGEPQQRDLPLCPSYRAATEALAGSCRPDGRPPKGRRDEIATHADEWSPFFWDDFVERPAGDRAEPTRDGRVRDRWTAPDGYLAQLARCTRSRATPEISRVKRDVSRASYGITVPRQRVLPIHEGADNGQRDAAGDSAPRTRGARGQHARAWRALDCGLMPSGPSYQARRAEDEIQRIASTRPRREPQRCRRDAAAESPRRIPGSRRWRASEAKIEAPAWERGLASRPRATADQGREQGGGEEDPRIGIQSAIKRDPAWQAPRGRAAEGDQVTGGGARTRQAPDRREPQPL